MFKNLVSNVKRLFLGAVALGVTVLSAHAQASTMPTFDADITAGKALIITVLTVVAGTMVFFTGARIYKWVTKK